MQRLPTKYLCVCVGGAAGSALRYFVGTAINDRYSGRFPLATFTINITGSFLIGLLLTIFTQRGWLNPTLRPLLIVGFLGGYTTFSAFEWETYASVQQGFSGIAVAYVMLSVAAGYSACWLGSIVGRTPNS